MLGISCIAGLALAEFPVTGAPPPGPSPIFGVSGADVACNYGVSGWYTRFGFSNVVYPQSPLSMRTQ